MNPVLELIEARSSTRAYDPSPLAPGEKQAILHAALRAPTAGNQLLYTIIEIEDQSIKDRLAVTCDDQPFIAKAPWVLIFVADQQKWIDLYRASAVDELPGPARTLVPGLGDLLMACSDALIAAQTAVIAAESLGIGSCYIGDIVERAEEHAELLGLPEHTLPVAMLCLGRPAASRPPTPRYAEHLVHVNRYQRLSETELARVASDLGAVHAPHGLPPGFANYGQYAYAKKFAADYQAEMNRSARWWIERWESDGSRGLG